MKTLFRLISLTLFSTLLMSCGFTLRGSGVASLSPESVYIQSPQNNTPLTLALESALQSAQMEIVQSATTAHYILSVGPELFNSTAATVNGRARAAQYTLQLSVEIALENQEGTLLAPERLIVERSYFEDTANIAGSTQEAEILRAEMRQDMVNQMMNRLRAVATNPDIHVNRTAL